MNLTTPCRCLWVVPSPAVIYNSVADNPDRLAKIKNFTLFYDDLKSDKLPQWMFITPNISKSNIVKIHHGHNADSSVADDGHDTSVTVAGQWARNFLTPLLSDKHFMKNTCVLLSKLPKNFEYESIV